MSGNLAIFLLVLTIFLVTTACGSDREAAATPTPVPSDAIGLVAVETSPQEATIDEGDTRQFTAIGISSDGSRVDVTSVAEWHSSDESVLTIDKTGLATAVASGTASVTAAADGVTSDAVDLEVFISFISEDGVKLRGRLFGQGEAFVVLSHAYPEDQTSWYPFAGELANNGYAVFTLDFQGYGVSEGKKEVPRTDEDLVGAVELVQGRGAKQVFLVGASMGGTAALKVAAREDVSGVVTISAPVEFRGLDVRDDVSTVSAPKLFIASEGDRSAAVSASQLFENAPGESDLHIVSGSAHGTDIFDGEAGDEVRGLILNFLAAHSQ